MGAAQMSAIVRRRRMLAAIPGADLNAADPAIEKSAAN
jgi:hypothetical protein